MASGNTMGSGDDDPSLTTSISGAGGMNAGQSLIARIMLAIVDVQVAVARYYCGCMEDVATLRRIHPTWNVAVRAELPAIAAAILLHFAFNLVWLQRYYEVTRRPTARIDRMIQAASQDLMLMDQTEFRKAVEIQLVLNTRRVMTFSWDNNSYVMTLGQLLHDLVDAACRCGDIAPSLMGIVDDCVEKAIERMELSDGALQHNIIPAIPYLSRRWREELVDYCCIGTIVEILYGFSFLDMFFLHYHGHYLVDLGLDHLSDYLSLGQSLTAMDDGREMDVNANIKSATIAN